VKAVLTLALLSSAAPAIAQPMDHAMHHHAPAQPANNSRSDFPAKPSGDAQPMPGMDMAAPMPAAEPQAAETTGTDQPPGSAEPPPVAHDRLADRYWQPADMAAAEAAAMQPPASYYARLSVDLAEYQFRNGKDGYRWEGEAWFGDLDRFIMKSDHAEVQALYAKALDLWWNLQLGVRQDIRPRPARTWATLGVEGRAPYQFEVQAAAFLSDKGQLAGRLEAAYDQRITQRLILQPRVEFDLSAQDMPDQRIGSGLSSAELGLRLRYEIRREFAPYVGLSWTWATGRTADYARVDGTDVTDRSVVAGIRFWF
jgi:copper resistance protein B